MWIHCCCVIVWILVRSRLQATRQALTLARSARQLSPSQPVNGSSSRLAQVLLAGTQVQGPSWHGTTMHTLRCAWLYSVQHTEKQVGSVSHACPEACTEALCYFVPRTCMCTWCLSVDAHPGRCGVIASAGDTAVCTSQVQG